MAEITNITNFAMVLDATVAEIDALVVSEPDYRVWGMLQQQLYALKDWSKARTRPDANKLNAITIGLIAARELEPTEEAWMQDLIDRLHVLNYFWRYWPTGPAPSRPHAWKVTLKLAIAVIVLAVAAGASLVALYSIAQTPAGPAMPLGKPMPIPGAMAALTSSLEPYTVSLNPNPRNERYQIQLKLTDATHNRPDRLITIAKHLQMSDLQLDTKLLGDDGHRLWFYVHRIGAWDYIQNRLVDADDLRRANPALGKFKMKDNVGNPFIDPAVARITQPARDLWSGESRLYEFNGRLKVTTPDYEGTYELDPESLHAHQQ